MMSFQQRQIYGGHSLTKWHMTHGASNTNNFPKHGGFTLEDKAREFGQSVADSLLECDPKDWSVVKKK